MIFEFQVMGIFCTLEAQDATVAKAAMICGTPHCVPFLMRRPIEEVFNEYHHLETMEEVEAAFARDFPPDFNSYLRANKTAIEAAMESAVEGKIEDRAALLAKRGS